MVDKKGQPYRCCFCLSVLVMLYFGAARRDRSCAEQGDSFMSGVCRHCKKFCVCRICRSVFEAGCRQVRTRRHPRPAEFEGQPISGAWQSRLCSGAQLLFLSGGHPSCRSAEAVVGSPAVPLPIILSAFCCWVCCWAEQSADFYVPLVGCRSCCTKNSNEEVFPRKSNRCVISNMGFWS